MDGNQDTAACEWKAFFYINIWNYNTSIHKRHIQFIQGTMQTFKWMDVNRESTKIQIKKEGGWVSVAADEE